MRTVFLSKLKKTHGLIVHVHLLINGSVKKFRKTTDSERWSIHQCFAVFSLITIIVLLYFSFILKGLYIIFVFLSIYKWLSFGFLFDFYSTVWIFVFVLFSCDIVFIIIIISFIECFCFDFMVVLVVTVSLWSLYLFQDSSLVLLPAGFLSSSLIHISL